MKGKIVAVLTLAMVFAMLVSPVLAAPAPPKAPAPPAGPAALVQSANASGPARYFVISSGSLGAQLYRQHRGFCSHQPRD